MAKYKLNQHKLKDSKKEENTPPENGVIAQLTFQIRESGEITTGVDWRRSNQPGDAKLLALLIAMVNNGMLLSETIGILNDHAKENKDAAFFVNDVLNYQAMQTQMIQHVRRNQEDDTHIKPSQVFASMRRPIG